MARKSTSQFKAVNNNHSKKWIKEQQTNLPPIEETFDNAKQAFINTLEVSIKLAGRVDNLMNIRDYAYKFWGEKLDVNHANKLDYLVELMTVSIETYKAILDRVEQFDMEEFLKEDMKDYFEDIIPQVENIVTEEELCTAGLIFLTVKPYGEKMTQLHHTMLDEKKQREFIEKGE